MNKLTENNEHHRKYFEIQKELSIAGILLFVMMIIMSLYFLYG